MSHLVDAKTCVIIPNWNGLRDLKSCIDSLKKQTLKAHIIIVDNGSVDGSVKFIEKNYPEIELIKHTKNKGYAGGVNPGFRQAIKRGLDYAAPFNNDAIADPRWLERLVTYLQKHEYVGVATCKILNEDGTKLDSTGDYYTNWGLPYPRGRGETNLNKYDRQTEIFGASGGASLYRVKMLKKIGIFDEDFFAYYEDVDLSFRAQLAGWEVAFVPTAIVYHQISATSSRIPGFSTYQTIKNLPLLLCKNVPRRYLFSVGWRFTLAHALFFGRAVSRGNIWPAVKGLAMGTFLVLTCWPKRRKIQRLKTVTDEYIWSMLVHDMPPNAGALRKLRAIWWKMRGKYA